MSRKKRKGQSTVEYLLILAVVLGAVITFATGTFRTKVGTSLEHMGNQMENVLNRIQF